MRLAYADPPYPGRAHLYAGHPDYAGEVDHEALVEQLREYDGWALSTSAESLHWLLPLCVKHTVRVGWEPVIVVPAREPDANLRDWVQVEPEMYQWRERPAEAVIGQKPEAFCLWVFAWLGAEPGDELVDLFPGSGAVARAWACWSAEPRLPVSRSAAADKRAARRARERELAEHPRLFPGEAA